jgi:hypothetical protein
VADTDITLMSVIKSGELQTGHSGMLPGYVIMKGTKSIHRNKMTHKMFVIELYGYCEIPNLLADATDGNYDLTWTDDHSKSECAETV